jgi:hypothetical protein
MSQPKYRIVKRTGAKGFYVVGCDELYIAQRKVLDLFWVDCRWIDSENSHNTYGIELSFVEKYIHKKIKEKEPIQQEVVKTFYEN